MLRPMSAGISTTEQCYTDGKTFITSVINGITFITLNYQMVSIWRGAPATAANQRATWELVHGAL